VSTKPRYPLATLAPYGPDDKRATKLVVAILMEAGQKEPAELRRWFAGTDGVDVRTDPVIGAEVAEFLKQHGVKQAVACDRIIGCPHEEGVDYPLGGTCPQCPFWEGTDRFTHEPKAVAPSTSTAPRSVGRNGPCPCGSGKKYKKCCGQ
jgi:hypothetical protein